MWTTSTFECVKIDLVEATFLVFFVLSLILIYAETVVFISRGGYAIVFLGKLPVRRLCYL